MGIQIHLLTWWRGRFVGQDHHGNRYFEDKRPKNHAKVRRWVIYRGMAEASKVPAQWHGWLHHACEAPPLSEKEKPWEPNLTGTKSAYKPKSSVKTGISAPSSCGYNAWDPEA